MERARSCAVEDSQWRSHAAAQAYHEAVPHAIVSGNHARPRGALLATQGGHAQAVAFHDLLNQLFGDRAPGIR